MQQPPPGYGTTPPMQLLTGMSPPQELPPGYKSWRDQTAMPLKEPKKRAIPRVPLVASPGPAFWASLFGGTALYFSTSSIYTFQNFYHEAVIAVLTFVLFIILASWLYWQKRGYLRFYDTFGSFASVPAIATLIGLTLGMLVGMCIYFAYGRPATVYATARIYENVVASAPAASFADAGRLLFSDEARVDTNVSVGYFDDDGNKYCMAAIRDPNVKRHVQFFAVGMNCCGLKSEFNCDAANNDGAGGGVVVYDGRDLLRGGASVRRHFDDSRRKLEATFDLATSEDAIYVQWLDWANAKAVDRRYRTHAWVCIAVTTFCYAVGCGIIVWTALKPYAI